MQGEGQLTGPVTRCRITQDRVKRFSRSGPRASGQGHSQQQQRREPQLGPDPEAPLRRRHFVPSVTAAQLVAVFFSGFPPPSGASPFPAPQAAASASAVSSAPP